MHLAWDARPGPGGYKVGFDRTTDQHIGRAIHVVDVILREKWRHPAGLSRWIVVHWHARCRKRQANKQSGWSWKETPEASA